MTKPYDGRPLDPGRVTALARLHRRVGDAIEAGQPVPCCGLDARLWISEDRDDLEAAAHRCGGCPLFDDCRTYVSEYPEVGATWAAQPPAPRGAPRKDNN